MTVIHYAIGQRYDAVREDGKRVEMTAIACAGTRVFLPKGHKATHSIKVNCKQCIDELLNSMEHQQAELEEAYKTGVECDPAKFQITRRERSRERLRQYFATPVADRETLERLKL